MEIRDYPNVKNEEKLAALLNEHQEKVTGVAPREREYFSFAMLDGDKYLGGITGNIHMNTLYISLLAIKEDERGNKIGEQLLAKAEETAREHQCSYMMLSTQDFQAKTYYLKHGFEILGQITDMPFEGTTKYYFIKKINK